MSGQHGSEQAGASVADLCARWVSIDREIEHLTSRWSTLEVLALRPVPRSGDSAEGAAEEMAIIDGRLAVLDAAKASCTDALATTSAHSFGDVVGKLDVAMRILSGEGGPVHDMVAEAVTTLPRLFADPKGLP